MKSFPLQSSLSWWLTLSIVYTIHIMRTYSTAEVAKLIGVSKNTLLRWLYSGKVSEPRRLMNGGQDVRIWRERDVSRVRTYKELNYWKGRGGTRVETQQ